MSLVSPLPVYLLYLDESGNPDNPADRHFVLAGVAVAEHAAAALSAALDAVQTRHFPTRPPVDFHAGPIRAGKDFWRQVPAVTRVAVLRDVGAAITSLTPGDVTLIGSVVEKTHVLYGEDAVRCATAACCHRFDQFLTRHHLAGNAQHGLLIFAEGRYDQRARVWVRDFRRLGTEWGVVRHLCDIPYFASAKDTRLLQAADFVAHALYLAYERGDAGLLGTLAARFAAGPGPGDAGLVHVTPAVACSCRACAPHTTEGSWGGPLASTTKANTPL